MKKQKMSLSNLKVQSFVTSMDTKNEHTVKGGGGIYPNFTNFNGDGGCVNECSAIAPYHCIDHPGETCETCARHTDFCVD